MADSVVSFLVENLSRLLDDEIKLLSGVEDKIKSLRNEMRFIDIFLKSSEGKHRDEVVKEVMNQIREVTHKAEDVVDTYIVNIAKHKRRNKLCKLFHFKEQVIVLHEVDAEIEKIKSRIDEIYKNKERYGIREGEFQSKDADAAEWCRKRRMDVEEEDVVGLVHDSRIVIEQLEENDSRLKVVSIIGMGGLGKTTLARKIYNKDNVKELFPCRAWGYVSNDYRPKELFLRLLRSLKSSTSEFENLSEEDLKKKVAEELKGKKYLVVLDDIWKTRVWDEVKRAFPDDKTGSRILITSRYKDVALYTGTTPPYHLPVLSEEQSWELFCKKVFRGEECPSGLEPLARSIAKSCGGLPLAIVVLSGLFAKKSQREWSIIKKKSWHLTEDNIEVMDILRLSYDSLPPTLKPCFLCFGIYPEDYEISATEVIRLWVAEGFIQPHQNAEPEELADSYLNELVDRSLVQVAKRRTDGGVKTCRIHDLLRDLCISESKSCKFLEVCTESNIDTLSDTNPRRLSLQCQPQSNIPASTFDKSMSSTRSVFIFNCSSISQDGLLKRLKLARVLHFESFEPPLFYSLPNHSKRMVHLRYLRIKVVCLPAWICSLWNLETLHVTYKNEVSSEIWKLKRLRHLSLMGGKKLPVLPKANRMGSLQTLWLRGRCPEVISLVNHDIFPRLGKLAISPWSGKTTGIGFDEPITLSSLHHLSNLHSLKIINNPLLPLDTNAFPSKLTKITFKIISWYTRPFMKTLGRLPNLQILKLETDWSDSMHHLDVGKGEFPQLQVFHMTDVKVSSWRLEEGAMPCLRHLYIRSCYLLFELPQKLWSLRTLRLVHIVWPSQQLLHSIHNLSLWNYEMTVNYHHDLLDIIIKLNIELY